MIRLVASDMDGTLLNRYGKISPLTIAAIEALNRKNIGFLVCTGRNFPDAIKPLREAGISCDIICMNGAAVFDSRGERIRKQPLLNSQVNQILNTCRPFSVLYDFMTEEGSCTTANKEEFRKSFEDKILLPMVSDEHTYETIAERFQFTTEEQLLYSGTDIYKMSVVHENPETLKQIRFCLEKVELTHRRAKKGTALLEYAVNAKIRPREILAIGDSENDLSMLDLPLGYTIAMGNASDVIKRSARLITRTNDEDGVAVALKSLILSDAAAVR
jgi:Cof subfamily protein (haloacid dehalogenase superfamily)